MTLDLSPPTEFHQLAKHAYALYKQYEKTLPDVALSELQEMLDQIYPDLQEAYLAIHSIAGLMTLLRDKAGDDIAADKLQKFMEQQRPHFTEVQEDLSSSLQDIAEAKTKNASHLSGRDVSSLKVAPKFGAKPTTGIKLSDLKKFNPAMRTPRPKKP